MARHHAVPNDAALDRLIIRLMMMKVPKAPFVFGSARNWQTTGIISDHCRILSGVPLDDRNDVLSYRYAHSGTGLVF